MVEPVKCITTTNVVCMGNLHVKLDLNYISCEIWNTVYKPTNFSGLIWQHRKIERRCLVFNTGKIICTGISLASTKWSIRRYARILEKHGFVIPKITISLLTMSMAYDIGNRVDLKQAVCYISQCIYEPSMYNGLIITRGKIKLICFGSGKVMITGVKTNTDVTFKVMPTLLELELFSVHNRNV